MKDKKSKKALIFEAHAYMWNVTSKLRGRYTVFVILIAISQLLSISLSYIVGKGIDVAVGTNTSMTLTVVVATIFVISILKTVFSVNEATYHIRNIAYNLDLTVELYTLDKLLKFSPGQATRENTGFKMDTLQKGSAAVAELTTVLYSNIIPTTLRIIISIALLYSINWMVASVVLVSICLFSVVSVKLNNYFADDFRRARKLESDVETKYWEIVKHLKLVVVMAMQSKTFADYRDSKESVQKVGSKIWSKYNIVIGYSRNLPFENLMMGCIFFLVFALVRNGDITVGDVAVVMSLISVVFGSINTIGQLQRQVMRHSINVLRLKELVEQKPECSDIADSIELVNPKGDIKFDNVTFSYESAGTPVLKNVSFHIRRGETVAFVGHSGSGKSTIVSLILRGYIPQRGEISIDDLPLNTIHINSWRRRIGIVSQQTMLWDSSVKDNVLYGVDREIDNTRLDAILESACIHEFYDRLGEKGINTVVGENGVQLSGGQCQRISIARVLARDPSVVIFDEATSALDYETEAQVFTAMNSALEGRTGIIIAHRLGTVRRANRIIVLDKGEIVGEGSYEDLLVNNEHFKNLIGSQIK